MPYRSLLVLLDHGPACATRTHCATRLAQRLNCHLSGLAPTDLIDLPTTPKAAASIAEYAALVWDALREQAERAADSFRDACHAAQIESFEAFVDEANKAESVLRHARCSDLTVLTQADRTAPNYFATKDLVESVVLHSARPTLVLPCAGRLDDVGRRVMVAWNESREASRAVADALPLLEGAVQVDVVAWNEAQQADPALSTQLEALRRWLARHGVAARMHVEPKPAGIADAMRSRAAELNADLIVMGAWGHSRWAERVLGGATRGLLETMTVPLLMSH